MPYVLKGYVNMYYLYKRTALNSLRIRGLSVGEYYMVIKGIFYVYCLLIIYDLSIKPVKSIPEEMHHIQCQSTGMIIKTTATYINTWLNRLCIASGGTISGIFYH